MKRNNMPLSAAFLLIGAIVWPASTVLGQSIGCARMPSTVGQYFGYGYGAGHHAPIVRTPGHRPTRAPRMAVVHPAEGALYPAPYGPGGCVHGQCSRAGQSHFGSEYGPAQSEMASSAYGDPAAPARLHPLPTADSPYRASPVMEPQPPILQYNVGFPQTTSRQTWR
jgi:hypothetical protein